MAGPTSDLVTEQPQPKRLSRRLFIPIAAIALAGGGIALRGSFSKVVEDLITGTKSTLYSNEITNPNFRPIATADTIAREISDLINEALVEISDRGRSPSIYRTAYETLGEAAAGANNAYKSLNKQTSNAGEYRGFEIYAKMWQAFMLLNQAGRNIVLPGESINVSGVEPLVSGAKLGASFRKFNYFKALEHYESVEKLLDQAKSLNITLPTTLSVPLYKSDGTVAGYDLVYKRMLETIIALLEDRDLSAKYHPILQAKKAEAQAKLGTFK